MDGARKQASSPVDSSSAGYVRFPVKSRICEVARHCIRCSTYYARPESYAVFHLDLLSAYHLSFFGWFMIVLLITLLQKKARSKGLDNRHKPHHTTSYSLTRDQWRVQWHCKEWKHASTKSWDGGK